MVKHRITIYDLEERARGQEAIYVVPEIDSCTIGRGNSHTAADFGVGCSDSEFYPQVAPLQCAIDRLENLRFDSMDSTTEFPLPIARVRHLGEKNKTYISRNGGKTWSEVLEPGVRLDDNDWLSFGYHDREGKSKGYKLLIRIDKIE